MSTGNFEPGIGAIVGSAIFNILVIPAVSVFADGKLSANRDIVYKEAQFYMLSIAVLLLTSSMAVIYKPIPGEAFTGELTRVLGILPVHVYGLYVFIQYMDTRDSERKRVQEVSELKEWALLATSLVFILVGVEGLVRNAVEPGEIFNTPFLLWVLQWLPQKPVYPIQWFLTGRRRRMRDKKVWRTFSVATSSTC